MTTKTITNPNLLALLATLRALSFPTTTNFFKNWENGRSPDFCPVEISIECVTVEWDRFRTLTLYPYGATMKTGKTNNRVRTLTESDISKMHEKLIQDQKRLELSERRYLERVRA